MPPPSQKPRHTSRLTREMNRDPNRSMFSVASSTGSNHGTVSPDSTMNDFNPEADEAIMSTHQLNLDFSTKLPEIRDTAKKYGRWAPRSQQDFVINTSAIGRAFPDFTQGSSSDDMSFEVSRGAKARQRTTSGRSARAEYSGDMDSPIVTIGNIQITGTPGRGKPSKLQQALRNSSIGGTPLKRAASQKENIPPPSDTALKGSPYISHASRTANGERKSLAELHAKVTDDPDASYILAERPTAPIVHPKNTRFSGAQQRAAQAAPTPPSRRSMYADAVAEAMRNASDTPSRPPKSNKSQTQQSSNLYTPNPTQQSFLLPNQMAEASVNVSGTLSNGMPVFTRDGKVHSRFSSGQYSRNGYHGPVDGIPIPDEEEDIYLSLEIMKERVAQLEMEKAESRRVIDELQQDKYQLEAENKELERNRRADSALGMADNGSDAEGDRNNQTLILEKAKLEANVMSLQDRLEASENNASNLELRLKTNTAERDAAVHQLAKALHDNEQLELENETLTNENEALRRQLTEFVAEGQTISIDSQRKEAALRKQLADCVAEGKIASADWQKKETALRKQLAEFVAEGQSASADWQKEEAALRTRIQRQDEVVRDMQEMTQEIKEVFETTREINMAMTESSRSRRVSKGKRKSDNRSQEHDLASKVMEQAQKHMQQITAASADNGFVHGRDLRSMTSDSKRTEQPRTSSRSQSLRKDMSAATHLQDANSNRKSSRSASVLKNSTNAAHEGDSMESGSDFASIVGDGFMNGLRQSVRNARAVKRDRLEPAEESFVQDDTVQTVQSAHSSRAPSVKGILKNTTAQMQEDLTGRLSVKSMRSNDEIHEDRTTRSDRSHHRHRSDSAIQGRTSRTLLKDDEMTSAFIIPDITPVVQENSAHPVLSASARRVLDGLCQHESNNCTICSRVASFDCKTGSKFTIKQKVRIEKPVPVSERMPEPASYEDEPTIRPAVEPGLALATVIKGLQDEVAHLKLKQAKILEAYNKHDASLGLRYRKRMNGALEQIAKSIEVKSDQIYALFDVLEGQKQSGQEMNEKDVELTLLSIGVDPEKATKISNQGRQKNSSQRNGDDIDDEDSELDLPWEGIEDTTASTGGVRRKQTFEV